jgi:hypothetical protein
LDDVIPRGRDVAFACLAAVAAPPAVIGVVGLAWTMVGGGMLALLIGFYAVICTLLVAGAMCCCAG